jgi:hypothetical protein
VSVLNSARSLLGSHNVRLHKIISNSPEVVNAFPPSEVVCAGADVEFDSELTQRTLGVAWSVMRDEFVLKVDMIQKPFTKRGILSTINSINDPIGIASPMVLRGHLVQRRILRSQPGDESLSNYDWDDELPEGFLAD